MKILVIAAHALPLGLAICQDLPETVVIIDDGPTLAAFEQHIAKNITIDLEHLSAVLAESLILIPHNYGHSRIALPDGKCVRGACTEHGDTRYSSRESRHPP